VSIRESNIEGYRSYNPAGQAFGRYQFTPDTLVDRVHESAPGRRTCLEGEGGVRSDADFLGNASVQENACIEGVKLWRSRLTGTKFGYKKIGQRIDGLAAPFRVSESGLIAAAHRHGAGAVRKYLDWLDMHGWVSDFHVLSPELANQYKAIETRLREFENIPLRRQHR
jgi:hypothetical protein